MGLFHFLLFCRHLFLKYREACKLHAPHRRWMNRTKRDNMLSQSVHFQPAIPINCYQRSRGVYVDAH